MTEITILKPDDWHLHFRDCDMPEETVAATARCFWRAIMIPNLVFPVNAGIVAAKLYLAGVRRIPMQRPVTWQP